MIQIAIIYFASGLAAMASVWLFVETLRLRRQIKANRASITKHHRKHRDSPERNLSREIQAGMAELNRRDADMAEVGGIEYRFLGATGEEQ
jgi:2',3'-cyclic-nucleotide 2'-phosphodiesterase (5'-nucleotidase family)